MGKRLAWYSVTHFWVDFACALLVLGKLCPAGDGAVVILLYNFMAFAGQMPLGLLADWLNRNHLVAGTGVLLVGAAFLTPWSLPADVVAGLGNALFHVGGGLDTLNRSQARAAPLGIFVSPGALGLFLGGLLAGEFARWAVAALVGLGLLAAAVMLLCRGRDNAPVSLTPSGGGVAALVLLALVVVLRSWLGLMQSFPWKGELGLALVCAVVLGKVLGGLVADRAGVLPTAAASLGLAVPLFLCSNHPVFGLLAVLLFNMTMPLTLWAAARVLPGGKGFAFGLLTFALFLGFLPAYLGWSPPVGGPVLYAIGAAVSLPLLQAGLRKGVGG